MIHRNTTSGRLTRRRRAGGFTLVELLISIGLLALLMVGVTLVYSTVSRAVGAGQALASAVRDSRAAQSILYDDLKACAAEGDPFFLIHSERQSAFLRESDLSADSDKRAATVDLDADGAVAGSGEDLTSTPLANNYRNCRNDLLGFFVRDLRRKQTGSGTQLTSRMGSRDAYVWYGHLAQRGEPNETSYFNPGDGNPAVNTRNYFSSQWVLGRMVLLLSPVTRDRDNMQQVAIDTLPAGSSPAARPYWDLLAMDARASRESNPLYRPLQSSRNDLVFGTIADMNLDLKDFLASSGATADWWRALLYSSRPQNPAPTIPSQFARQPVARFRAVADPEVPLTGDGAALSTPLFIPHCRNFVVEFSGDFVTQMTDVRGVADPDVPDGVVTAHDVNDARYGQVTAAEPDGKIDFYTVATGATNAYGAERVERARFYGLPRDADRAGVVRGGIGSRTTGELTGVVPLRDVIRTGASQNPALAGFAGTEFERAITFPARDDYAAPNALPADARYTCVWGPGHPRPAAVRIVVTLEDPNDRLGVGQTYEYVLDVAR